MNPLLATGANRLIELNELIAAKKGDFDFPYFFSSNTTKAIIPIAQVGTNQ